MSPLRTPYGLLKMLLVSVFIGQAESGRITAVASGTDTGASAHSKTALWAMSFAVGTQIMTDTTNAGPVLPSHGSMGEVVHEGLLLRDYFAAKAMQPMLDDYCRTARKEGWDEGWKLGMALQSYAMADAMLAAREVKCND